MSAADARSAALDAARGLAVLAMFAFHFTWDLAHFGYVDAGLPFTPQVKALGHAIAVSFLLIAGVSLVLARSRPQPWRGFFRRLAIVFGAALLVTAGTYLAFPEAYVFFGILHCIGVASLLAAPLLFWPWPVAALAALAAALAPMLFVSPRFDAPPLQWIGFGTFEPLTNDYQPILPWAGALFAGVALAKLAPAAVAPRFENRGLTPLAFLGRHSLLLYLLHQPVFFLAFSAVALVAPAPAADGRAEFVAACVARCEKGGGAARLCDSACRCTAEDALADKDARGAALEARVSEAAKRCAAAAR